jgi:hypothetical protein
MWITSTEYHVQASATASELWYRTGMNKSIIERRGDHVARAIRDERDEWQHRADDSRISRQAGGHIDQMPELKAEKLSRVLVAYVAEGGDPCFDNELVSTDQPLRLSLTERIARYKREEDGAAISRAMLLAHEERESIRSRTPQ